MKNPTRIQLTEKSKKAYFLTEKEVLKILLNPKHLDVVWIDGKEYRFSIGTKMWVRYNSKKDKFRLFDANTVFFKFNSPVAYVGINPVRKGIVRHYRKMIL